MELEPKIAYMTQWHQLFAFDHLATSLSRLIDISPQPFDGTQLIRIMRVVLLFIFACTAAAFSPQPVGRTSSSSLNLFGGGGEKKGPGMMDQLAMFKKAQEVAQKKAALDKELQAEDFKGTAADGKVTAHFKYVPIKNPMDPNPDYEMVKLEMDDDFFEESSAEDISAALKEAYTDGVEACNKAVMEKYQSLTAELGEVFGGQAKS